MNLMRLVLVSMLPVVSLPAAWVWVEGEHAAETNIRKHPWYSEQVKKDALSGGEFLAHYDRSKPGEAEYRVRIPAAGAYTLWLRANPVQSMMTISINGSAPAAVDFKKGQVDNLNIAANNAPDLRFLSWSDVGRFKLNAGDNTVRFVMTSADSNHGSIDCFVFTAEPFLPSGVLKPDQQAQHLRAVAARPSSAQRKIRRGKRLHSGERRTVRALENRPSRALLGGQRPASRHDGER